MKYLLFCLPLMLLCACSTISPNIPRADTIAFVDGFQDAGVKGKVINTRTGEIELLIVPTDRIKYNALINIYSKRFIPALVPDQGLTYYHGQYAIRNDDLTNFGMMKGYEKQDATKNVSR